MRLLAVAHCTTLILVFPNTTRDKRQLAVLDQSTPSSLHTRVNRLYHHLHHAFIQPASHAAPRAFFGARSAAQKVRLSSKAMVALML